MTASRTPPGAPAWPTLSVVVPVHNERPTLERCIDAVLGQRYPGVFEAIFVDNGSRDGSRELLERHRGRLVPVFAARRGPGAARNAGIRRARHPWIAFCDADAVPEANWLRAFAECARRNPRADFIGGRVVALDPRTPVERFEVRLHDQRAAIERYAPPTIGGGNMFARRDRLLALGLFDESLLRGEDSDLCYRAFYRQRCHFVYADAAVVRHANRSSVAALFAMGLAHGRGSSDVWRRWADELGRSRWRRCLSPSTYARAARPLAGALAGALSPGRGALGAVDASQPVDLEEAFLDTVFRTGKELGFLYGTLRRP